MLQRSSQQHKCWCFYSEWNSIVKLLSSCSIRMLSPSKVMKKHQGNLTSKLNYDCIYRWGFLVSFCFLKVILFGLCGVRSTENGLLCWISNSSSSRVSPVPAIPQASCQGDFLDQSAKCLVFVLTVNSSYSGPDCCVPHTLLPIYCMGDRLLLPAGTWSPAWYRSVAEGLSA